jgi:predicted acetyltransferase
MTNEFEEKGKAAIIEWLNDDIFQEWDGLNHFWNKDYDRSWELKNIDNFMEDTLFVTLELRDGAVKVEISFRYISLTGEVSFEEAEDMWTGVEEYSAETAFWRKIAFDLFRRG